uniref:TFIIS N-terminal domain-containing protein n=1 Tax=Tetradesmus obliquus TaxID=3088 RepID=A0A383VIA5_TETOB|eukprot:jgi/Sobl393_1/10315/SZX64931.1
MTKDKKITSFFSKQQHAPQMPRSKSRQASIGDLKKVVRLPKAGMCADDEELNRLVDCLKTHSTSCCEASSNASDCSAAASSAAHDRCTTSSGSSSSSSTEQLVLSLRQLACYTISIEQLERMPLAKQVKALRQHADPDVQRLASRLVEKLRTELVQTTAIRRQKQRKESSSLRSMLQRS